LRTFLRVEGVNLLVHLSSMPDPHNDNHDPLPVDPVYDAIVADANPKMVRLCLELLAAWRKRVFAERGNLLADAPLKLLVEITNSREAEAVNSRA
jgi:hypothetical protein